MTQPHIIHILSDEHMGMAMSCAGDPNVETPHLDALADGGLRFDRAYANCPVCVPSRGTIFSGRHAHAGPVSGFHDIWKVNAPGLATELNQAGYRTVYMGKWHCGELKDQVPDTVANNREQFPGKGVRVPEDRRGGFHEWYGFEVIHNNHHPYIWKNHDIDPTLLEGFHSDALTDLAIEYLRKAETDKPIYLVLSLEPPHFPLDAPESFERLDPDEIVLRDNCDDTVERREQIAKYYAMIVNLDWNIGRLLEAIETLPVFAGEKSCVTYISDHGELMGSHGVFCRKEFPYDEGVRIPAIFSWPGHIESNRVDDGLFSLVDFAPTILGLTSQEPPSWMQGHNWAPTLLGKSDAPEPPEDVLLEMTESPRWTPAYLHWRGLVDGRWKYAYYENGVEELFDLETDPFELENLADTKPETAATKRKRLLELLSATREPYFDVLMQHGAPVSQPVHYLEPPHPDMGFPRPHEPNAIFHPRTTGKYV